MLGKLSEFTSFAIGGEAEIFTLLRPDDAEEALSRPHVVLGRGTNVLVSDRGIAERAVINRMCAVAFDGECVYAESGASLAGLAAAAAQRGLSGLEWAVGIPGSAGGAAVTNAGAFGGCLADVFEYADVLRGGKRLRLYMRDCAFAYRSGGFAESDFILGVGLLLRRGERGEIARRAAEFARRRAATQPKGKSAGSVFKRADRPAGWYIERAGLKGAREGGAEISAKHANFIVNTGGASAKDVLRLAERAEERVKRQFGVTLEREIRIIGEI